jgi:hypothetical protein
MDTIYCRLTLGIKKYLIKMEARRGGGGGWRIDGWTNKSPISKEEQLPTAHKITEIAQSYIIYRIN